MKFSIAVGERGFGRTAAWLRWLRQRVRSSELIFIGIAILVGLLAGLAAVILEFSPARFSNCSTDCRSSYALVERLR